jgi:hypothetical protein
MKLDLTQAGNLIQEFFGSAVEKVARCTEFVQRASKLGGQVFLQALVFGYIENPEASLVDLAQVCCDLGVDITPQGLDERINEHSVNFLKEMFAKAMETFRNTIPLPLFIVQQFNGVNILDSSVLALPDNMAEDYPGSGGNGPKASLKVQLVFDLLFGNLAQVAWQTGREPDQNYQGYLQVLKPGSLHIADLGYFCLDFLKRAAEKAFFLSRYSYPTGLLTPDGERIDLLAMLQAETGNIFEIEVLLGQESRHRLPCRLMGLRAPQEVAARRRQKAQRNARRKGRRPASKESLALMNWSLFVTNVPQTMLSARQVVVLYCIRWQIELIFKLWKSYCALNRVAGLRKERVWSELYAKMIGIVLTHFLVAPLRLAGARRREVSPVKVRKIFQRFARNLGRSLSVLPDFLKVLAEMAEHIRRFGFKEKRKKHPNACQALDLVSAVHKLDQEVELPFLLA